MIEKLATETMRRPCWAPPEKPGGARAEKLPKTLDESLQKSEFWQRVEYDGQRGNNSRLFEDVPEDLDELLDDFDLFQRMVDKYQDVSLRWIGLQARSIARRLPLAYLMDAPKSAKGKVSLNAIHGATPTSVWDVAGRVQTRYWRLIRLPEPPAPDPKKPEKLFDPRSRLQIWYEQKPRSYRDFRNLILSLTRYGTKMELLTIFAETKRSGLWGHEEELKQYKEDLIKYEQAKKRGWTDYPDGTPVIKPPPPAIMIPLTQTDDDGETFEIVLDEVPSPGQNSRAHNQDYEDELDSKRTAAEDAFQKRVAKLGPLYTLNDKIADIETSLKQARAVGDTQKVKDEEHRYPSNLAEREYQIKRQSGQSVTRTAVAAVMGGDPTVMSSSWMTCINTFKDRVAKAGAETVTENLAIVLKSFGVRLEDIIDTLDIDPVGKQELKKHLIGDAS